MIEAGEGFDHRVGHLWALRMMSESSNAPFLRCFSAFASHRETNGVADAMIEAKKGVVFPDTFLIFQPLRHFTEALAVSTV